MSGAESTLLSQQAIRAWHVRKTTLGTIYAFGTADGTHVKIGFTTELQKRLSTLAKNVSYYGHLNRLVGAVFGTFAEEQRIHAALRAQSAWNTQRRGGREFYPASVLDHPVCRAIFGPPPAKKRERAA